MLSASASIRNYSRTPRSLASNTSMGSFLGGKYEPISCSNMRTSASTAENATPLLSSIISGPVAEAGPVASRTWHWTVTAASRRKGSKQGFPRGYRLRQKQVKGFKTGDRVRAVVPDKLKTRGIHVGRVQVRKSGSFDIQTHEREVEGVNATYCCLVQRGDGYAYALA